MKKVFFTNFLSLILIFTSIQVEAQNGIWTWMHGDSATNAIGNYGTQGIPAPTNHPPAMYEAASFTDLQGDFWIFGGLDNNFAGEQAALWKFDPITNMWTWMKGPNTPAVQGVYGVQGVSSPANFPGARAWGMESWVDALGNFWIFGGYGYDQFGTLGALGDLWKYDISINEWTWMSGSNASGYAGDYGTFQVASILNNPPARFETATSWTDNNGDLWMFGGGSFLGLYDDMWKFNISTNIWTWMGGSNLTAMNPNYGTQFIASPTNTPGGRYTYGKWKDLNGNLWLFGGTDNIGTSAAMWMYDLSTNYWTWMAGSNLPNDSGNFSQQCVASNEHPSSRYENRCCWTDACGRFWQYGGFGGGIGTLGDLWMFDPYNNQFTFVNGSTAQNFNGNYGTILIPSPSNKPSSGAGQIGFNDNSGNFWMFGGWLGGGKSNALWKFDPTLSCTAANLIVSIFPSSTNCAAQTIFFSSGANNPGLTYHWDFGDTNTLADTANTSAGSYYYTTTGTYTITLIETAVSGCYVGADTATYILNLTGLVTPINIGNDSTFCGPINFSIDGGHGTSWAWNTGDTTQIVSVNSPGTYWVITTNSQGCTSTDSITFSSIMANLGPDTMACGNYYLDPGIHPGCSYLWSTGAITQAITATSSGTYYVTITNSIQSCSTTDSIAITIYPKPIVTFFAGVDSVFCISDGPYVIPQGNPAGGYFAGAHLISNTFYPSIGAGNFLESYIFVDSLGCSDTASVMFTVNTCVGINLPANFHNLLVYPNPAESQINIQFETNSPDDIMFNLLNVNGQIVYQEKVKATDGKIELSIPIFDMSDGIYLLRILNEETIFSQKIIIQK